MVTDLPYPGMCVFSLRGIAEIYSHALRIAFCNSDRYSFRNFNPAAYPYSPSDSHTNPGSRG